MLIKLLGIHIVCAYLHSESVFSIALHGNVSHTFISIVSIHVYRVSFREVIIFFIGERKEEAKQKKMRLENSEPTQYQQSEIEISSIREVR